MMRRIVGVLGGMGPLATVDFMHKVIAETSATCDQDHIPLIVRSVPQVQDRARAILDGSDAPLAALTAGVKMLERAGAELIVIPCSSAHMWFDRIAMATDVPLLHIGSAVRQTINRSVPLGCGKIALMATAGTIQANIYQHYLQDVCRSIIIPDEATQEQITSAILLVKGGELEAARRHAKAAGDALISKGASHLLLACTELPLVATQRDLPVDLIDATKSLAHACIAFSTGNQVSLDQNRAQPKAGPQCCSWSAD
ncbi:aspartate/glutamate racemase family protein [Rhizobium rhizogenes]|uniref:aspartate/glutamate racemase family protein n=1 Tax=Rhizobium rhizogenes TaxID=359 RepID=UPI001297E9E7|nr:amino acid racemase [Rhizobium rhizogenes]MQB35184.1 aspartate/glutamate racemase family protein [Rhizobium rhizogenes]